jgi:chromosome segregation ATPase
VFSQIFNYIYLSNKKANLSKELKISKLSSQSGELSAIKDLIAKLNISLEKNKQKLKYFEEDFQNMENKVNQLTADIENMKKNINELNQLKKECFNQINKITRNMEENQDIANTDSIKKLGIDITLTNSEKIRVLQKRAQDAQFEINQLTSTLIDVKTKYEDIKPQYEIYIKDYHNMIQEIKDDELKLNELNNEFERKVLNKNDKDLNEINQKGIQNVRPVNTIEVEYNKIIEEMHNLSLPGDLYNPEEPMNLDNIIQKFKEIKQKFTDNMSNYIITSDQSDIIETLNGFRKLDDFMSTLENIFNSFLLLLNIESQFNLLVNNTNDKLFIKIKFNRKNKEEIKWNDFTTPERIFSIIGLFFSFKILLKSRPIIFSNLFLPTKYNKRGSIFRTLAKIIPLFERNEKFADLKIIYVLSNLELKQEIKNLKVITIQES